MRIRGAVAILLIYIFYLLNDNAFRFYSKLLVLWRRLVFVFEDKLVLQFSVVVLDITSGDFRGVLFTTAPVAYDFAFIINL